MIILEKLGKRIQITVFKASILKYHKIVLYISFLPLFLFAYVFLFYTLRSHR